VKSGKASRVQSYEESMGMVQESGTDDENRDGDPVDCYFTHDWSADEQKRSVVR
jgi:hypothetical protein